MSSDPSYDSGVMRILQEGLEQDITTFTFTWYSSLDTLKSYLQNTFADKLYTVQVKADHRPYAGYTIFITFMPAG